MSGTAKLGLAIAGLLVILAIVLWIPWGKKPVSQIKPMAALPYVCESCQHQFGVPRKLNVFPPIICPKCSQRTAVRAHLCEPAAGGEPQIFWYSKFDDRQIAAMEQYVKDATPEQLATMPAESRLDKGPYVRLAWGAGWATPEYVADQGGVRILLQGKVKGIGVEVYPKDAEKWPVIPAEQVRQR